MYKTLLAVAVAATLSAPMIASAEDAPAAPASPHTFTGNVGLYSQYVFRGLTQTDRKLALQGGLDYSHSSGIYAGLWGSNVSWLRDPNPSQYKAGGSGEFDFYGGFKGSFLTDFTYDVGVLQYYYPGTLNGDYAGGAIKANNTELYGALGWKWVSLKYSNAVSKNVFGVKDARGTDYWDLSVAVPIGETGLTVGAHYGIQKYHGSDPRNAGGASNDSLYSYNDWKINVAYDLSKLTPVLAGGEVGVAYTDTSSAHVCGYGSTGESGTANGTDCTGSFPRNIAKSQTTVYIKKTF